MCLLAIQNASVYFKRQRWHKRLFFKTRICTVLVLDWKNAFCQGGKPNWLTWGTMQHCWICDLGSKTHAPLSNIYQYLSFHTSYFVFLQFIFHSRDARKLENAIGRSTNSHYINLLLLCLLFKFSSILLLAEYTFNDADRTVWNQPKLQLLAPWV